MQLKPLPLTLGLRPLVWMRPLLIGLQVMHDERESLKPFKSRVSAMGRSENAGARFLQVKQPKVT